LYGSKNYFTVREEYGLRVFGNRVLKRVFRMQGKK
jgi:hypothetical protein